MGADLICSSFFSAEGFLPEGWITEQVAYKNATEATKIAVDIEKHVAGKTLERVDALAGCMDDYGLGDWEDEIDAGDYPCLHHFLTLNQEDPLDVLRDHPNLLADVVKLLTHYVDQFVQSLAWRDVTSHIVGAQTTKTDDALERPITLWITGGMSAGDGPTDAYDVWNRFFLATDCLIDAPSFMGVHHNLTSIEDIATRTSVPGE